MNVTYACFISCSADSTRPQKQPPPGLTKERFFGAPENLKEHATTFAVSFELCASIEAPTASKLGTDTRWQLISTHVQIRVTSVTYPCFSAEAYTSLGKQNLLQSFVCRESLDLCLRVAHGGRSLNRILCLEIAALAPSPISFIPFKLSSRYFFIGANSRQWPNVCLVG